MIEQIRKRLIDFLFGVLVTLCVSSCVVTTNQPTQKENSVSASDVVENQSVMEEQICQEIARRTELLNLVSENRLPVEESVSSNEIVTDKQEQQEEESEDLYHEGWTTQTTEVKEYPFTNAKILKKLKTNTRIYYLPYGSGGSWIMIRLDDGREGYIKKEFISKEKTVEEVQKKKKVTSSTAKHSSTPNTAGSLTAHAGVCYGPSGKETYYNLNMNGVVNTMRRMGNNDEYWVREDGCKMLGDYIMVAADLNEHPRGSIVQTSLGPGIVCDTGGFAHNGSGVSLDIATAW